MFQASIRGWNLDAQDYKMVPMPKDSRYIQIAFSIQKALANDGKLDARELDELLGLAMKDNEMDEDERRILSLIFGRLKQQDVTPDAASHASRLEEIERLAIFQALRENNFNRTETAKVLGISRRALIYKIQRFREMGFDVDSSES